MFSVTTTCDYLNFNFSCNAKTTTSSEVLKKSAQTVGPSITGCESKFIMRLFYDLLFYIMTYCSVLTTSSVLIFLWYEERDVCWIKNFCQFGRYLLILPVPRILNWFFSAILAYFCHQFSSIARFIQAVKWKFEPTTLTILTPSIKKAIKTCN